MRRFIASIYSLLPSEVWIVGIFIIIQPLISGNSIFFLVLAALFILIFIVTKSLTETTWLTFLASLPFSRGKYFEFSVLPASFWGGEFDLSLSAPLLFSDFLLVLAIYLILSRYKKLRSKYRVSDSDVKIYVYLTLFIIVSFISSYFSPFSFTSFYFFAQLIKFVLIFFVARIMFTDLKVAKKSYQFFVLFLFLNSLLVISQYINLGPVGLGNIEGQSTGYGVYGVYSSENPNIFRAGGFSPDPNVTATLLAVSFPILLTNTLSSKNKHTPIKWLVVIVLILSLILTASRAMWIITVFISLVTILYLRKRKTIYIPPFIKKSWAIILIVALLFLSPIIIRRIGTLVDIFSSKGGGTYRMDHIKVGLFYMKSRPVGTGIGTFNYSMALDFPPKETGLIPAQPHNLFAQLGAETGVFGLISFSLFLLFIIKKKYDESLKRPRSFSIFLSLSSYLLSAFFFPWLLHPLMGVLIWIFIAYPARNS